MQGDVGIAQHGYLGDGYGTHGEIDPDRDEDRERVWRGEDRDWRERGPRDERDRGFMFGELERDRFRDREYGNFGDRSERRRNFSARPDEHYRSWRDRHMAELDRDYEDYCREREQQFHQDFDSWRSQRQSNREPLRTGMAQTGLSSDPTGIEQAESEMSTGTLTEDPMATATLGTTSRRTRQGR